MNLIRQEILLKKLLQYRFRKYGLGLIKVEAYDTFEDKKYMCRVEVFKGGTEIQHRIMKYESFLDDSFAQRMEKKLSLLLMDTGRISRYS
ncbi:hypothetical protein FEE95_11750 [Maribacter algarum]|uniref:Uncharacterized protein n=1 Tax=Maribacter algarum (ex Zhang et al. 2020) TaxID=2578118 RepID=A0A5S3PRA6_9FLAO|nr:hypothetical protein [Maribacter algarum]TMM57159.1 hypothetical protein FEE95_11750 [Maribacter algarum]